MAAEDLAADDLAGWNMAGRDVAGWDVAGWDRADAEIGCTDMNGDYPGAAVANRPPKRARR
jgi:hypothetical protein